jgi:hypothetical protein
MTIYEDIYLCTYAILFWMANIWHTTDKQIAQRWFATGHSIVFAVSCKSTINPLNDQPTGPMEPFFFPLQCLKPTDAGDHLLRLTMTRFSGNDRQRHLPEPLKCTYDSHKPDVECAAKLKDGFCHEVFT